MNNLSRAALLRRIAELEQENKALRVNPNYGTLTRQALEIENRRLKGERYVVMIDIDYLHQLNDRHGSQEPVNDMIRRAFDFRHDDLLLKANYASGDEVVFLVRTDPEAFMERLRESLGREGITATMVYERMSDRDDLLEVCDRAIRRVYALKAERGVTR
jgi:hypothetical protein